MTTFHSVYGLCLESDYPFASRLPKHSGVPDLSFTCMTRSPVSDDWRSSVPVMQSPFRFDTGESVFGLYRQNGFEVLHFAGGADFYIWPDRIICVLLDPAYAGTVEICLLGVVISYWFERRGVLMLHASGVAVEDVAVGFICTSEGGKSSLAAAMVRCGYTLLTDDILPVKPEGDSFSAIPSYPQMRLWPSDAKHFLGHFEDLDLVHPNYSKRRAPVGENGFGSFCDSPRRLACLYLPRRSMQADSAIEITPIPRSEAVVELVRNSFTPNMVHAAGLQPYRLELMAQIARIIPVRKLIYPSGYEHLPEVCSAILSDIPACVSRSRGPELKRSI